MYAIIGMLLGGAGGALAFFRGRRVSSFYARDVYHMTERSHQRFAWTSIGFIAAFALALRVDALAVPLLAVYVLVLILYLSSFARGYSGEDE